LSKSSLKIYIVIFKTLYAFTIWVIFVSPFFNNFDDNIICTFVNAEILRQGYANLSFDPRLRKYNDKLQKAYREAREEKRGLHGI